MRSISTALRSVSMRFAAVKRSGGEWMAARGYAEGGVIDVPHSEQNLAVPLSSALQLAQCLAMGVPQASQNFAPARTWLWHCEHSTVSAAAGAVASGAGAGGGVAGCTKPGPPPANPGPGGAGVGGACGGVIIWPAMPKPAPTNMGPTAPPPLAIPSPAP